MEQIAEYLQKIEGYEKLMPSIPPQNDEQLTILHDMVQQVKNQTDNFTKPEGISTIEVDVRPILSRENVEADQWIKHKGKMTRTEKESLEWLIDELNRKLTKKTDKSNGEDEDKKQKSRKRLMLKAKAAKAKLLLLNL